MPRARSRSRQAVQEARRLLRPLVLQRELDHGFQRLQPLLFLRLLRLRQHVQIGRRILSVLS